MAAIIPLLKFGGKRKDLEYTIDQLALEGKVIEGFQVKEAHRTVTTEWGHYSVYSSGEWREFNVAYRAGEANPGDVGNIEVWFMLQLARVIEPGVTRLLVQDGRLIRPERST